LVVAGMAWAHNEQNARRLRCKRCCPVKSSIWCISEAMQLHRGGVVFYAGER
jgi:hypothetical protein